MRQPQALKHDTSLSYPVTHRLSTTRSTSAANTNTNSGTYSRLSVRGSFTPNQRAVKAQSAIHKRQTPPNKNANSSDDILT